MIVIRLRIQIIQNNENNGHIILIDMGDCGVGLGTYYCMWGVLVVGWSSGSLYTGGGPPG